MGKIPAGILATVLLFGATACGTQPAPKPASVFPVLRGKLFPAPPGDHGGPRWVYVPPGNTVRSYPHRFGGGGAPGKTSKVPAQGQAPAQENGYWLYVGPPGSAPR